MNGRWPDNVYALPDPEKIFVWLSNRGIVVSQHKSINAANNAQPQKSGSYNLLKYHNYGAKAVATLTVP